MGQRLIVDYQVVGQRQALGAAGLGGEHAFGQRRVDAVALHQSGFLQGGWDVDHQDPVQPRIRAAATPFGQQRDRSNRIGAVGRAALLLQGASDNRVQDCFQRAPCRLVSEHPRTQAGTVQASVGRQYRGAKVRGHGGQRRLPGFHDLSRNEVGIGHENAACSELAFQRALARGNAAGQSDEVIAHALNRVGAA